MNTATFTIRSVGCRTNQEEISALSALLCRQGFELVHNIAEAHIIIINTCAVTGAAEGKVNRLIASCVRQAPGAKLCVTGCLAQQIPHILAKKRGVCWVVGNRDKDKIPQIIQEHIDGIWHTPELDAAAPVTLLQTPTLHSRNTNRTRFFVKIQEGCDYRCSYCIVPLLRGKSRSAPKENILTAVKKAIDLEFKEIVLTGTHIGQYTQDSGYTLTDLLNELLSLGSSFRIRLSSLDPRDCSESLLALVGSEPRMCDHLHLSLQSLSPEILKKMHREYESLDIFTDQLLSFRSKYPHIGLGADFIVGFPGESRTMFEMTVQRVIKIGFNYGHVFRYSIRPGTKAVTMDNHIEESEKTARSKILREQLTSLRCSFIQKQLHTVVHTIVVEKTNPIQGLTSNYIRVEIPDEGRDASNRWLSVNLISFDPDRNCCTAVRVKDNDYA